MAQIELDNGVYHLVESTFDLMINWNNIVMVCFYGGSM